MSRWTGGHPPWLLPHTVQSAATHGTSWTGNHSPICPPGERERETANKIYMILLLMYVMLLIFFTTGLTAVMEMIDCNSNTHT